jgi:hypothetical protein
MKLSDDAVADLVEGGNQAEKVCGLSAEGLMWAMMKSLACEVLAARKMRDRMNHPSVMRGIPENVTMAVEAYDAAREGKE